MDNKTITDDITMNIANIEIQKSQDNALFIVLSSVIVLLSIINLIENYFKCYTQ